MFKCERKREEREERRERRKETEEKGGKKDERGCDAPKPGGPLTTRQPVEYS